MAVKPARIALNSVRMKSEPLNFRHGLLGIKLCHGEIGEILQRECESRKNGRDHAAPVAKRAVTKDFTRSQGKWAATKDFTRSQGKWPTISGFSLIARKMGCNQGILPDRKENGLHREILPDCKENRRAAPRSPQKRTFQADKQEKRIYERKWLKKALKRLNSGDNVLNRLSYR